MRFYKPESGIILDGAETNFDYFEVDGVIYQALQLKENDFYAGRGINSTVLRALPVEAENEELVIKICNFPVYWRGKTARKRRNRFRREIRAMKLAIEFGKGDLVAKIVKDFGLQIGQHYFRCFLMEKAEGDLGSYLKVEHDISLQQRLLLCLNLMHCIQALHEIGIYHRDIKPGNILNISGSWKFGDLGLVALRGEDEKIDGDREKIGPPKWMSPEAVNKENALMRADNAFIDRIIDERSDNYQLGKLFWYILQGDIPNGCMKSNDLVVAESNIYGTLLRPLLSYRRSERPTITELLDNIEPLRRKYAF